MFLFWVQVAEIDRTWLSCFSRAPYVHGIYKILMKLRKHTASLSGYLKVPEEISLHGPCVIAFVVGC